MEIQNLAQQLWQARIEARPCSALTGTNPRLTIADAYAISKINFERRITLPGVKSVGKKIGLTSRAVQKQLGVEQPDYGFLTSDMMVKNNAEVSIKNLIQPRVEGEVVFILRKNLQGPGLTAQDVIAATEALLPCIEIIDSRIENWQIKIQDTIADNASSAMFVIGDKPYSAKLLENLQAASMKLYINQQLKSEGVGAACLDHPINAVVWLANALAEYQVCLNAGEIILSGAFGPVVPVIMGDFCTVTIAGLGQVAVRFN